MRVYRAGLFLPLVTAAVLLFPTGASAADPVHWRSDYNAARREAAEKGLPLFLVVGTDNCFYCRKLEAGPFRDASIINQLGHNFVPLKIDANREPNLANALKVQVYPTMVLAGADGKIHAFIEGYLETDRLREQLSRAVTTSTTTDWSARDFEQATRALAIADYPRAVSLLKGIVKEAGEKPIGNKARQVLAEVEKLAAGRLARAQALEARGFTQEAVDTLAEAVKTYAGTQAAADAASLMTGMAAKPDIQEKLRARSARDLLASAREELRTGKYHNCLETCEQLAASYADTPEGKEAKTLQEDIRNNPERLAIACEQMNERTAALYLTLAEAWARKGQGAEAIAAYETAVRLIPNSRVSDIATAELLKLRAKENASPAGLRKP